MSNDLDFLFVKPAQILFLLSKSLINKDKYYENNM